MSAKRTNPDFLNGVPELLLLHLLSRQPMYGYELVKAIHRRSAEALDFGEGCIYPTLHRLEAEGFLIGRRMVVGGRSRVVYRLTDQGFGRLEASRTAWQRAAAAVRRVLEGGAHDEPALA
jgi:PadR family transcriptional regulator PadR